MFAGRPSDSNKGLDVFLSALEIVEQTQERPLFLVWVIGGSERETTQVHAEVCKRPNVHSLLENGRLTIWGRVENSALPELYSRAYVVVMPSRREEFGIVAVEAMMCSCPVIASRVGGLKDIVLDGRTGLLIEPDNPLFFADAITGYLRNPAKARNHGNEARMRAITLFDKEHCFAQITDVLIGNIIKSCVWNTPEISSEQLAFVQQVVPGGKVRRNLGDGYHLVLDVLFQNKPIIIKLFAARPSLQADVFPGLINGAELRPPYVSYQRCLFHKNNPAAIPIIAEFDSLSAILCETGEPHDVTDSEVAELAEAVRRFGDGMFMGLEERYLDSITNFAKEASLEHLAEVDCASEAFSKQIGGNKTFVRSHPQIELWRIQNLLNSGIWPLPEQLRESIELVVKEMLFNCLIEICRPRLCHGDIKPGHVLKYSGSLRLCDFEHTRYVVGPFDEANWIIATSAKKDSTETVFSRLVSIVSPEQYYSGCCWLVLEVVFRSLLSLFSLPDPVMIKWAESFLKESVAYISKVSPTIPSR